MSRGDDQRAALPQEIHDGDRQGDSVVGSVPDPISSSSTSAGASSADAIPETFLIRAEKVLSPSGID